MTAEARAARLISVCASTSHRRDIQHVNEMRMNNETTEIINDELDNALTQQCEEGYDDGVIPNEIRRKFGDRGDRFYECEHCGAFRMKQIHRFKYSKGDDNKCFCCNG